MTGEPGVELWLTGEGGLRLAASKWGQRSAPPVLLLHGAGQSRHAWRHTAAALAGVGWQAIAVDHRGHGDSGWPDGADYEFDHFADDVEALVAQMPSEPVVVGASLGGVAALVAQGRRDRQLFRALVLVDVTPAMEFSGVKRIVGFMAAHPEGFETPDEASRTIAAYTGRPAPDRLDGLHKVLRFDERTCRWHWHWDPRFLDKKLHVLSAASAAARAEQVRAELDNAAAKVAVPTLLVRGAQSDLVTPEAVRALLEVIPGSRFVDVAGAGHMVAGDDNDHFTNIVVEFLSMTR